MSLAVLPVINFKNIIQIYKELKKIGVRCDPVPIIFCGFLNGLSFIYGYIALKS